MGAGGVVLVRLAGEADHHIRADAGVGDALADGKDTLGVLCGPISPVHETENPVAPAL